MYSRIGRRLFIAVLAVAGVTTVWSANPEPGLKAEGAVAKPAGDRRAPTADPFDLVSSTSLLHILEQLTTIEEHSGWRSCGSAGEREALDLVEHHLSRHSFLRSNGLEVSRQSFRTIAAVEIHQARLQLEIDGMKRIVPADAIVGHPYDLDYTRIWDSDGTLGDLERDPVTAQGRARILTTLEAVQALAPGELEGKIAVLDFALIDSALFGRTEALARYGPVFDATPAGLVVVTSDSLTVGESHGSFALDSPVFAYFQQDPPIPMLVTRIEDLEDAGLTRISDLQTIERVSLTWDEDVVSPGQSGNVVARIPGRDSTRNTILSAHLDSSNTPGALDNGSGSAALLEIARVLDRSRTVPPVDIYLVWFGCHEKGVFGSAHFAATSQEILDRSLAMIELDAMGRPLDGLDDPVNLESWSYNRLGDDTLPLPEFLQDQLGDREISADTWDFHWLLSDITGFVPYDVPNALTDNLDFDAIDQLGSAHYTAHWHTPNDRLEHARAEADQFERLTKVMLSAALDTGALEPDLRVTPAPSGRAVFLGNHTEAVHMAPFLFTDLGTILAWEGLDVDLVPYGGELTADDLEDAALVVVLPVHDYPNELGDIELYDERWTQPEIAVLVEFVENGGLLVLTNGAARLGPFARARESNEDRADLNELSREFGIQYLDPIPGSEAVIVGAHDLVAGVDSLTMLEGSAVAMAGIGGAGLTLATAEGNPVAALVQHGRDGGEVLALGDIGMLVSRGGQPSNFTFWQNLARYAASR